MRRSSALLAMAVVCCASLAEPTSSRAVDRSRLPILQPQRIGAVQDSSCNQYELPFSFTADSPCVGQPAHFVFSTCSDCVHLSSASWSPDSTTLTVYAIYWADSCEVSAPCTPESLVAFAGVPQSAGDHFLTLRIVTTVVFDPTTWCLAEKTLNVGYVARDCPPAPPDSLPYVNWVTLGTPPCATCPEVPCAGQPIPVSLGGFITNDCYVFRRVELLPSPTGSPAVRAVFAQKECLNPPCQPASVPWQGSTVAPALPAGSYSLRVESTVLVTCGNDSALTVIGSGVFPFAVIDSCGTPPPPSPCLWTSWQRPAPGSSCDALLAPGQPAKLRLALRATEPVAGLQGKLLVSPVGLEVRDIHAIDFAQGMRVVWSRLRGGGASFVLFSESGQRLPACDPRPACPACCIPSPVLEVTFSARDSVPLAPITEILVTDLLGADSLGNAIPSCEQDRAALTARICAGGGCDANHDGATDIRDLVGMVRCLMDPGLCTAPTPSPFDCQRDGDFDLDDVICCARVLLQGQVPDSAKTVPAPTVYVRFGDPAKTDVGLDVPIAVNGCDRLGAARLGLALPLDRFDVTGLTVAREPDAWLALHELRDEVVSLGLIRIRPPSLSLREGPDMVEVTLHLALKPGQSVAGLLSLLDGDFTGSAGEMLIPGQSQSSIALGGRSEGALSLSAPRPNPTAGEVAFSLTLEREAEVDVSVHDLNGRLIATLHRGRMAPGSHPLTWSGRREGGAVAANGLYFVRAQVGDRVLTRKLTLLAR